MISIISFHGEMNTISYIETQSQNQTIKNQTDHKVLFQIRLEKIFFFFFFHFLNIIKFSNDFNYFI
jgi:hypothetical protein